jgi:hypothetical protein
MTAVSDALPMFATIKQVATATGLTPYQIKVLLRERRLLHVRIGARLMIPRDAVERFLVDVTVPSCLVETPGRVSASLTNEGPTTLSGQKAVAAGSAARARQIALQLKSRSQSSSENAPGIRAPVIPLRSS